MYRQLNFIRIHKVVRAGARTWAGTRKCFSIPTSCECKKFKWIWLQQVGSVCRHHLHLQSQNHKVPFLSPHQFPKFASKKPKVTTKVTLQEPPIKILCSMLQWLQKEGVVKTCLFEDDLFRQQGAESSGRAYTPANPEDFPQNPTNTQITVSIVVKLFLSVFGSN